MPQPHEGSFPDGAGAARVLGDQGLDHLAIPFFRMLHVEYSVEREVVPLFRRDTEAAQSLIDIAGARRGSHLD